MENIYVLMRDFLNKRGIIAREENANRLLFSVNGLNFTCDVNESDPYFLRLSLPQINGESAKIEDMYDDIHRLNRIFKVCKIVIEGDSLWILADSFVYSSENVESLFERLINAMTDMINEYRKLENSTNGTVQTQ